MKITIWAFWIIVVLGIIVTTVWLLPGNTYMNTEGCLKGKPPMSFESKKICNK